MLVVPAAKRQASHDDESGRRTYSWLIASVSRVATDRETRCAAAPAFKIRHLDQTIDFVIEK
jgi:hypothetical protein